MAQVHRIRITLTSRNVKNLEKGEQLWPHQLCSMCLMPHFLRHLCCCEGH